MTKRSWAIGVALAGVVLVGMTYGCVWYAVPDRPVSREWVLTVALMSGPYLLRDCPIRWPQAALWY